MKRLVFLGLILVVAGIASFLLFKKQNKQTLALAAVEYNKPPKDENIYYWFDVRVKVQTRDNIYRIISVGSRVYSGTIKKFDKAVWKGLSKRRIVIGPFVSQEDAQKAQKLYRVLMRAKTRDDLKKAKIPTYDHEVYWFALKFKESKRLRIFIIEHNPARVESGNARDFLNALFETLTYQQISIGPFEDYQRTEDIKRIYRRNE